MPRYEFSEGTSNKFWDIQLTGSSFTTTWGKIGTAGQTATKSFASDDKARQEHDKLVAEKVKKGYLLVGTGATPAAPSAAPTARSTVPAKPAPAASVPVAKPAAPTPPPAPAPAPAPAPTPPPPVATAGTGGAAIAVAVTWTDLAKRHLAHEQRGLAIAPRPCPSATLAYERVTALYRKSHAAIAAGRQGGDDTARDLAQRVIAAVGSDTPPAQLDAEAAAAVLLLVGVAQHRDPDAAGHVLDLLVARGGLGFALEAFAASLGDRALVAERDVVRLMPIPRRSLTSYLHDRSDLILHGHWLGLDAAAQAEARTRAEALRATGSLIVRSALASALLVPAWIDDDLAGARATGERAVLSPQALLAATRAADVAAYLEGLEDEDSRTFDREPDNFARWHGHASPGLAASLVARFGADAVLPLAARIRELIGHLDLAKYYLPQRVGQVRLVLEVMRSVSGRTEVQAAAVEVLRAVADQQIARDEDARPIARDCLIADPHAALPLVRAHAKASWAKELIPQLERLVTGPAQVDYADPAELPTVVQAPAPAKTKLPEFWNVELLPPLILTGGRAVPTAHLGALVVALRADDADGLRGLRDAADRKALAGFAWALFQLWLQAGAPPKEKWAFTGLGALGNDDTARRLTPLIRAWPGESQHARATLGLDVLGQLGSDVALMMLNGIAQKLKFKGLQERARDKMREIAELRGITAEQLADRLVPDLDLEDDGSKTLDFGPRSFRVGFDETLAPFVMDAAGTRLKDLPKPNSKDDAALATEATDAWKAMKKDARAVASIQLTRLELAMGNARRWSGGEFRAFFVEHPLLFHVVKRLVWAVYDGDRPTATFRVAEDRSYADRNDDAFELADDARVGLAHRLHLTDDDERAWTRVFADYELEAPFAQLGREVFRLTPAEAAAHALTRYEGKKVETKKLLGLLSRGWFKGPAQDAGCISNLYKPLEGGLSAAVGMSDGLNAGGMDYVDPVQTLDTVDFAASRREWTEVRKDALALGALPAVVVSEVIRDLESLGGSVVKKPGKPAAPAAAPADEVAPEAQRPPAEVLYAAELEALRASDTFPRPPGWRLSPRAVRTFILGDDARGIRKKFVGHPSLVDRAMIALSSNRGLMLIGEPGTAKSLLSELLAAAICGQSTLTIQGSAGTSEDQIKYSWNYALLLAEGPTLRSLVPAPLYQGMRDGTIVRFEEITRCPLEVQDLLLAALSDRVMAIPELEDGKQLFARVGFNVIATANTRDLGVNEMSAALKRRFNFETVFPIADYAVELALVRSETRRHLERSGVPTMPSEQILELLVTTFRELRDGRTDDGHAIERLSTAMSTAEAVSVAQAVSLRSYYLQGQPATPADLVECLVGAAIKTDKNDVALLRRYFEQRVGKRKGQHWQDFYAARHALPT